MSTLSLDLRQRILDSYDAGEGTRQDMGMTFKKKRFTPASKGAKMCGRRGLNGWAH